LTSIHIYDKMFVVSKYCIGGDIVDNEVDMRRFTLRMTATKLRKLKIIAANEDTNINAILNNLIDEYLSKKAIEA
jgi:hypothetical protein